MPNKAGGEGKTELRAGSMNLAGQINVELSA